jgi:uracil-DNA glycosylase
VSRKEVLVIGESPRLNPRAKTILMDAMLSAGFEREDFRWINVLPEAPPEGKNITKTMVKNARERLLDRVEARDPKYVVLMGNTPCQAYLEQTGIGWSFPSFILIRRFMMTSG